MQQKQIIVNSLKELEAAASTILDFMDSQRILAISGKMGAGKTTLIKAICEQLEVVDVVNSPTFALVNQYESQGGDTVFHFDLYRVKKLTEVYDIGYEEYFFSDHYCFIEWPELILELLPDSYVYLLIEVGENEERIISLEERTS